MNNAEIPPPKKPILRCQIFINAGTKATGKRFAYRTIKAEEGIRTCSPAALWYE